MTISLNKSTVCCKITTLWAYSSAVELLSYTQAVIGSNPFAPKKHILELRE